ncbi:MAG: hypothetical protein HOV96_10165 [Nonomuraea sp.]|nr:hypothetical protein [Nonomuraea sp.]NUP77896.1 hypothetical protein [Nonomuraea sp.]NUS08814.1 hypothetical protein [Nonomuraea sp.]
MSEKSGEELPEAVGGVDGESDVVAERSGSGTPRTRRPLSADPPDEQDEPEPDELDEDDDGEDVIRPDAGPTG